jgi:putative spermidine/putrescine transport system permease protein
VRIYGWFIILGSKGFINTILLQAGFIEKPLPMIFNSFCVVDG